VNKYIVMKASSSNKGWHQQWFYLRSDADVPLSPYTGCSFEEALERWGYGPIASEKKKIDSLLQAAKRLVDAGVTGAGLITAFHERRVLPLMRRAHRLDEMVPNASLEGTMLVMGGLIVRRSRGASSRCSGVSLPTPSLTPTRQCVLMMTSSRW
jgi:hypothetical protein